MATIFETEDSVFFVGGTGTKAGNVNAGGCTKAWYDANYTALTDIMSSNGAALIAEVNCTYTHSSTRITKSGAFGNAKVGMVAYIAGTNITIGRYKITAVDPSGNYVDVSGIVATGDNTDTTINVGGAFDKLQNALDNTEASNYGVDIFTNKGETFSAAEDQIDVDTGGGNGSANTWKRIIGIDDSGAELPRGSYVTIDANNKAAHVFVVNDLNNIEFRHIYAYNAGSGKYGWYYSSGTTVYGLTLKDCKSTDCDYGIYMSGSVIRGIAVVGGYYSGDVRAILFGSAYNYSLIGAEVDVTASNQAIWCGGSGTGLIIGCIIRKNGSGDGIYHNGGGLLFVVNNTFFKVANGIAFNHSNLKLVEYNNIFYIQSASSGKAINRTSGSIAYSDYSCLHAIDGEPTANGRWGGGGKPKHAIEEDPGFEDYLYYRPLNPKVLRGGKLDWRGEPSLMGSNLQKYQFAQRARMMSFGRLPVIR